VVKEDTTRLSDLAIGLAEFEHAFLKSKALAL
jgi:hypothetical protein